MDGIQFVNNYQLYLSEIALVIKPQYESVLNELRETDPHDLIEPDSWFLTEREARGFVWSLFLKRVKKYIQ